MDFRIWMDSLSAAGRLRMLEAPSKGQPQTLIVEQWDGQKWIERKLIWDGQSYVEVK